jgi:hypothetical protein
MPDPEEAYDARTYFGSKYCCFTDGRPIRQRFNKQKCLVGILIIVCVVFNFVPGIIAYQKGIKTTESLK